MRTRGRQSTRRIVEKHARGPEIRQLLRLFDELLGASRDTGAVDEAGIELPTGGRDRLAGLAQVRDVVQRVVQTEDLDAVLGGAGHEAGHEVTGDRLRADEEAPAKSQAERRLRPRVDGSDLLPGALHPTPHGAVEHPTARDLERSEPRAVEDLDELEQLAGRDPAGQRRLAEQANGRVDERGHAERVTRDSPGRATPARCSDVPSDPP